MSPDERGYVSVCTSSEGGSVRKLMFSNDFSHGTGPPMVNVPAQAATLNSLFGQTADSLPTCGPLPQAQGRRHLPRLPPGPRLRIPQTSSGRIDVSLTPTAGRAVLVQGKR